MSHEQQRLEPWLHGHHGDQHFASQPSPTRRRLRSGPAGESRTQPEPEPEPESPTSLGEYSPEICHSPKSSSGSEQSMCNHKNNVTPPESPVKIDYESPAGGAAAVQIGRLSIDHEDIEHDRKPARPCRGRGVLAAAPSASSKRSASTELSRPELSRPESRQPLDSFFRPSGRVPATHQPARRVMYSRPSASRGPPPEAKHFPLGSFDHRKAFGNRFHQDSGYETGPSRSNTMQHSPQDVVQPPGADPGVQSGNGLIQLLPHTRYPGLILQPDSSPISHDQLSAEVNGIYAGLVMVEAKCINVDAVQAAAPDSLLSPEQWQELIALHRTLLYEHHDFLMATQHPSATPALRGLATKYSMPARMWKHGIHAFLEVLRHRRPGAQDYMLAFIYLAYQMMALLFETVPSFTDTWIECLGDLARYRMAIEEDKETHATWGGVAARWYTLASDRHPAIGRLYHHLGILERPSLRKFCLYAKSLTCVIPFPNARDSLSTLCGPIVQNIETIENSSNSAEARTVTFHALLCSGAEQKTIEKVGSEALRLLHRQLPRLKDNGAYLAVANIAAMLELGTTTNMLWQLYATAIDQAMRNARPSVSSAVTATGNLERLHQNLSSYIPSRSVLTSRDFCYTTFNTIITKHDDRLALRNCMGFALCMLTFFHSLLSLRTRLNEHAHDTFGCFIDSSRVSWCGLADFLNSVLQHYPITDKNVLNMTRERARKGDFERKEDARPLSEDYLIRGLIWGQFYFPPGWFDGQCEDDGRTIETPGMQHARAERVLWLGFYLAFHHKEYITYDAKSKLFTAGPAGTATREVMAAPWVSDMLYDEVLDEPIAYAGSVTPRSRSSMERSSSSHSEDGFVHVKPLKVASSVHSTHMPPSTRSYASVASGKSKSRKVGHDVDTFKVVDADSLAFAPDHGSF